MEADASNSEEGGEPKKEKNAWKYIITGFGGGLFGLGLSALILTPVFDKKLSEKVTDLETAHVVDVNFLGQEYASLNNDFESFVMEDQTRTTEINNELSRLDGNQEKMMYGIVDLWEDFEDQTNRFEEFKVVNSAEKEEICDMINDNVCEIGDMKPVLERAPKWDEAYFKVLGKAKADSLARVEAAKADSLAKAEVVRLESFENDGYYQLATTLHPWIHGHNVINGWKPGFFGKLSRGWRPLQSFVEDEELNSKEKKKLESILKELDLKDDFDGLVYKLSLGKPFDAKEKSLFSSIAYKVFERYLETEPYKKFHNGMKPHSDMVNPAYLDSLKQSL